MKIKLFSSVCLLSVFLMHSQLTFAQSRSIEIDQCRLTLKDNIQLTTSQSGKIVKLNITIGSHVQKGQLLVQLDDRLARSRYEISQKRAADDIEYRYAAKASEIYRIEYETALKLNDQIPGARSKIELEQLRLKAERTALQVEQALHNFEIASLEKEQNAIILEGYQIRTPISGVVVKVLKQKGELVQPGEPVLEIVNLSELLIEGFIPLNRAMEIETGMSITAIIELPHFQESRNAPRRFHGHVLALDSTVQALSQNVRFVGVIENQNDKLRAGMPMRSSISLEKKNRMRQVGINSGNSPSP